VDVHAEPECKTGVDRVEVVDLAFRFENVDDPL
jgi:hypothetical protein